MANGKRMRRVLVGGLIVLVTALAAPQLQAQCTTGTAFGSGNLAGCTGTTVIFTTCAFAGEYSVANGIEAGNQYTFTGTGGTANYLSIVDHVTAAVMGFGPSPVTVVAPAAASYRVYVHTSGPPTCGTETVCHTLAGTCALAVPPATVTVGVGPQGGGTVSGGGEYAVGDTATVTATPSWGWQFLHWQVGGSGTLVTVNPYSFEVTGDVQLVAVFQLLPVEVPATGAVGLGLLLTLLASAGVLALRRP
jgi:hypothetical protein